MSLFEDNRYRWRETFFVLLESSNRPTTELVKKAVDELGSKYELTNLQKDEQGRFESLTLRSPYDFSALDVTYVEGEDVTMQMEEMNEELVSSSESAAELEKVQKLSQCDARFDIFHFEEISETDEDEFLDPGTLLIVLEKISGICNGIGIDPQSGSLM